ncbi:unnamed protein product, partial [Pleuronectes platessa]
MDPADTQRLYQEVVAHANALKQQERQLTSMAEAVQASATRHDQWRPSTTRSSSWFRSVNRRRCRSRPVLLLVLLPLLMELSQCQCSDSAQPPPPPQSPPDLRRTLSPLPDPDDNRSRTKMWQLNSDNRRYRGIIALRHPGRGIPRCGLFLE